MKAYSFPKALNTKIPNSRPADLAALFGLKTIRLFTRLGGVNCQNRLHGKWWHLFWNPEVLGRRARNQPDSIVSATELIPVA